MTPTACGRQRLLCVTGTVSICPTRGTTLQAEEVTNIKRDKHISKDRFEGGVNSHQIRDLAIHPSLLLGAIVLIGMKYEL